MSEQPLKKPKLHKDKHKSRQNKVKAGMKNQLFDLFSQHQFNASDAVNFLHDVEKDLDYEPEELCDFRKVVEEQWCQLSQPDKRSLISTLTHKGGELNNDMLKCLPSLRSRSEKLLANPDRKERNDKIDVTFISDFMHDYCRQVNYYKECNDHRCNND